MSSQLNDLRLQLERLNYDNKECGITIDILKEQNQDAARELEELRQAIADLKANQKDPALEDKEKKKQEKMALMMAKFDTVRGYFGRSRLLSDLPLARHVLGERRESSCTVAQTRLRGRFVYNSVIGG